MLTVPVPSVAYEPVAPGVAALELPVTVALGPVTDDGRVLEPPDLAAFGLVVQRRLVPWALPETWDPTAGAWMTAPSDLAATPYAPVAFLAGKPQPWQAILVPAAGEDAAGAPVFAKGAGGAPAYGFAGLFVTRDDRAVLGGSSSLMSFVAAADRNLVVMGAGDGEQVESATQARLQLRSPSSSTIGGLVVDRSGAGARVTLSNSSGASVVLRPDGSIELRPAAGRGVEVVGDLETGRITYQPAGGGPKKPLT